ncbi:GbsR/MarR family transcriptional regulator [Halorubrum sp. SD626R]|jgi:DNA-binding transcriptional regulator GbsR (MarR family)|uniref:GbsR/MarR family transcriptional regulator n=1 Tax=Halorubrum sp. SD626R TaxID=1419722 RepID=UPI000A51B171|nr:MarR family transcriptional regulator [Halorubrum sp. SD626R]TKX80208.1 MarR family transcriptional regulator [Halorubrum sp. SD626R]
MSEDAEVARERVIESLEQSAEVYGLSRSAGRIYGVLYFATDPLSIPELVERTGYAKSTVSNVTRTLTRVGLIRRRSSDGGGRRVRFTAEREVWFIVQDVFQQYVYRELQTTHREIRRAERGLGDAGGADDAGGVEAERIRELRETYADLREIVELVSDLSAAELRDALESYER